MKIRMLSALASGVVLVAGMASNAFAHEKMMGKMDMMAMMDTNHDGMVSADEHAVHARMMFKMADTNHDGMMSKPEMDAAMKMMHDEHMMKHGAMKKDDGMMKDDAAMKKDGMMKKDDSMSTHK